jgi:hypothetical protein
MVLDKVRMGSSICVLARAVLALVGRSGGALNRLRRRRAVAPALRVQQSKLTSKRAAPSPFRGTTFLRLPYQHHRPITTSSSSHPIHARTHQGPPRTRPGPLLGVPPTFSPRLSPSPDTRANNHAARRRGRRARRRTGMVVPLGNARKPRAARHGRRRLPVAHGRDRPAAARAAGFGGRGRRAAVAVSYSARRSDHVGVR